MAIPHSALEAGSGSRSLGSHDAASSGTPRPRGVELDLVDASAGAIVGAERRRVALGQNAQPKPFATDELPQPAKALRSPLAAFSRHRLPQDDVVDEGVVVDQRRRLVQD